MRTEHKHESGQARDPLGLRELPQLEPDRDDWPAIRAALESRGTQRPARVRPIIWLAAAATVVLAVGLLVRQPELAGPDTMTPPELASEQAGVGPDSQPLQTIDSLIAMSQSLEGQLRKMRQGTVSMPADSAIYVAELEDMVAQVDEQLSYSPDSLNLWGQRINLLLDLAQIYQHQWERDYGLMASL